MRFGQLSYSLLQSWRRITNIIKIMPLQITAEVTIQSISSFRAALAALSLSHAIIQISRCPAKRTTWDFNDKPPKLLAMLRKQGNNICIPKWPFARAGIVDWSCNLNGYMMYIPVPCKTAVGDLSQVWTGRFTASKTQSLSKKATSWKGCDVASY